MKITSIFSLVFSFTVMASAAGAAEACFTQEFNPTTNKVFASQADYDAALSDWQFRAPTSPGLFSLARAYAVYNKEKATAQQITNDKRAHCYVGCRISQDVDFRTAEYVGWLKEDRDIKDCNKGSHFDAADFDATVVGAQLGQSQMDATGCMAACKQNF